jgi:L-threonylcarbamoyladenylate synthase
MTEFDGRAQDSSALVAAANHLKSGGVFAYPTDTVYGLGALASDDEAVRRLYRIKERELDKPLPLLIAAQSELAALASDVSTEARILIDRFWPGGLTIVLPRKKGFHSLALTGDTVAVRVPNFAMTRRLIELAGQPITGTSANHSGAGSCRNAQEVRAQLANDVDFILNGGPSPGGVESTVVDCTTEVTRLLRQGAVSIEEIERTIGHSLAA